MIQYFMIFLIETLRDIGNFWLGCVRLCFQSYFMFIVGFLYKQVWMILLLLVEEDRREVLWVYKKTRVQVDCFARELCFLYILLMSD